VVWGSKLCHKQPDQAFLIQDACVVALINGGNKRVDDRQVEELERNGRAIDVGHGIKGCMLAVLIGGARQLVRLL
jgi:hypothetical protein